MQFSKEELKEIYEKSSTIQERLSTDFIFGRLQNNDALVNARINQWCKVVADGNWKQFKKRLSWDGLNLFTARLLLNSVEMKNKQKFPCWTSTLNECLKAISDQEKISPSAEMTSEKSRFLDSREPLPFEEILSSFIFVARQKLSNLITDSHYKLISETAHASLERSLLRWLTHLCTPSMEFEFSVVLASKQSTLVSILKKSNIPHKAYYQQFISSLRNGEILTFFKEYPVLARLMATAIDFWVNANRDFISHLASDWSEIQKTFHVTTALERVLDIQVDISDRHQNGLSVMILTFMSGLKLVYKPRNLDIDQAYIKLLDWLNNYGLPISLKSFRILNRSSYGWVEFIETAPCKNAEESSRYYQRCGMLLCLAYILNSTDLHHENIISSGENPVLIDLETLMHPLVKEIGVPEANKEVQFLAHSVMRTALLPQWRFGETGEAYDVSGFGGTTQQMPFPPEKGHDIDVKKSLIGRKNAKAKIPKSGPFLDEIKLELENYHEDLVNGFQQMYRFLMERRSLLLAPDSPLTKLGDQVVRFIFRNTSTYASVLQQSLNPKFLRDGAERSIQLDILSRPMLSSDIPPLGWPLLQLEQQALEVMDIPLFTTRTDSDTLTIASNRDIEKYFKESSFELLISRLNKLNDEDLRQQTLLIRGSLYSRIAINAHSFSIPDNLSVDVDPVAPLTQLEIVEQARDIAIDLQKQAISSNNRDSTWLAPQYNFEAECFQLQPMKNCLFEGRYGVAVFLAALEKVTKETQFRNLTLGALQSLRQDLHKFETAYLHKEMSLSGAIGRGGIIYALVCISQFLNEPEFLENAKQLASFISPKVISNDQKFDIVSGAAGEILGLLALHNISVNSSEFLEQAIAYGNHLLENRSTSDLGYRAWATSDRKLLTGFSHGAAGIAYALLRLYQASGNNSFLQAAQEAINYERSVFIPEVGNWPDFRQTSTKQHPNCMCSWCHGAPGIGLARVAGLDVLYTNEIQQDIEAAIRTTVDLNLQAIDQLCCGNLGRIEFLFTAARKLSRSDLLETVMTQSAKVVSHAQKRGHFGYGLSLTFHPGFFQGAAGIGYQLLRLAYPDQLPSILLWE